MTRSRAPNSAVSAPRPRVGAPASTCSRPPKPRTGPFRRPRARPPAASPDGPPSRRRLAGEQGPTSAATARGPGDSPDHSRAKLVRERPDSDHPDSRHDVVGAHEQHERTAWSWSGAPRWTSSALHTTAARRCRRYRPPPRRLRRPRRSAPATAPTIRRRQARSRSHRRSRAPGAPAVSRRAGCRAQGQCPSRRRGGRSRSPCVEGLLGEHHLGDIGAGGRQHDHVPRGQDGPGRTQSRTSLKPSVRSRP